jgi:hypothetical protein
MEQTPGLDHAHALALLDLGAAPSAGHKRRALMPARG